MERTVGFGFISARNGAEGGTRTRMGFPTRPSNVRVYQFHHFGVGRALYEWLKTLVNEAAFA
jgi:hypothetical protein